MGNSASNANANRGSVNLRTDHGRTSSTSPTPGQPHRSLRTKKKSLELPDLASLSLSPSTTSHSRGRQTKAIPIPSQPPDPFSHYLEGYQVAPDRPRPLPSTDLFRPAPTPAPRGRQQPLSAQQQAQVTRIQELYDRSHHPAAPPSSPASAPHRSFMPEVVRSSIPTLLTPNQRSDIHHPPPAVLSPIHEDLLPDPVPVKICWSGGGKDVVLARAGDDDWKGRQQMQQESPDSATWTATVFLRPGTHHVRFLIDNQWRVADDLPTAVDDQGSLANYVAVPLTYGLSQPPPPVSQPIKKLVPGQSFWSADSSADGENDIDDSSRAHHSDPTKSLSQNPAAAAYIQANWTNVIPPELAESAREEELYLAASAGQYDSSTTRVTGFVPAPNIPPAPGLPRHLDKLILNTRVGERAHASDKGSNAGTPTGGIGAGVGSGQGGGRREKRDRDRDDRRGDKPRSRRANVPPPPPPSEDGPNDMDVPTEVPAYASGSTVLPSADSTASAGVLSGVSSATETTAGASGSGPTTAATSPQVSHPVTPTGQLSPTQSSPKVNWTEAAAGASSIPGPSGTISGSRTITIDTANLPALTDDGSVLPVPSHVVLHHLCTSAIKNGVLAVASTTRYRKKYLTTIYYKPT